MLNFCLFCMGYLEVVFDKIGKNNVEESPTAEDDNPGINQNSKVHDK